MSVQGEPQLPELVGFCEWGHCTRPAELWIQARWTIFDFDEFNVCFDHLDEIKSWLRRRTVGGMPLAEWDIHLIE